MANTGSTDLKTVEWGDAGASRTALLVHGLTGRAEAFEALAEKMAPATGVPGGSWRLLAPDLRGRGASREVAGGEAGIPEHTRDLLALLDKERLDRVVFVGHSLGAMIGVYLAAGHPERVSGLVLIDGGADVTDEIDALISPSSIERLERTYSSREAYIEHVKNLPAFKGRWDEHLERYFAGDVKPDEAGEWHPVADLETVRDDREKMRGFPLSELWSRIECPTLILLSTVGLAGPEEGFVLPPQEARRMHETIFDSTLVKIENTNHFDILYSAPEATVDAIRAFLAQSSG